MLEIAGSDPVALALGTSWELSCYRTLQGTVTDIAVVLDNDAERVTANETISTEFNMEIACCDKDDDEVSSLLIFLTQLGFYFCCSTSKVVNLVQG